MDYIYNAKTAGMEILYSSIAFIIVDEVLTLSVSNGSDEFILNLLFSSSKQNTEIEQEAKDNILSMTFSAKNIGNYISKDKPSVVATMGDGTRLRFAMYTKNVNSKQMLLFYSFLKDTD